MKKNKFLIIPFLLLFIDAATASINTIHQTTRMQSSAGVGVGAVLLDEATLLNPAPMAFYQIGAIYYQQEKLSGVDDQTQQKSTLMIASDSKGPVGGSVSYIDNELGKNLNVSLATPVAEKSALGITYRNHRPFNGEEKTTFDLGISHAITEFFTFGAVLKNPQRVDGHDTRLVVGSQFVYEEFISLMVDFGTDWKNEIAEDLQYGGAIQFKTFSDIYLRMGTSRDKKLNTGQSGVGVSWVSPKIIVSLSASNIEDMNKNEKSKNSSFAVSYKF